jgi:nucleotide-binding universal stress UspA family protein
MSETKAPPQPSTYASIMVTLNLGVDAEDSVKLASSLATTFSSRLIGVAAEEFVMPYYGDGAIAVDPAIIEQAKREAAENLAKAETVFRRAAGTISDIEWRSAIAFPNSFALEQARAADLVVVGRRGPDDASHGRMAVSPGDLAMGLGRPILVVPPRKEHLSGKRIVVAWKDTREARRAVWDALPLLKRAEQVFVLAIGPDAAEQGAADVSEHLHRHGVASRAATRPESVKFVVDELTDFAEEEGADLIVSGAYGHSRMREWLFGGVTQELLESTPIPCLLSH